MEKGIDTLVFHVTRVIQVQEKGFDASAAGKKTLHYSIVYTWIGEGDHHVGIEKSLQILTVDL